MNSKRSFEGQELLTSLVAMASETSPHQHKLGEVRQGILDRVCTLSLNDAEIVATFVVFEPRSRGVIWEGALVRVHQLFKPCLLRTDRTVPSTRFANCKVFVISDREGVVEVAIHTGEAAAYVRVDIYPYDVDVVGAWEPLLKITAGSLVRTPKHKDFRIVGDSSVNIPPRSDEFGCG